MPQFEDQQHLDESDIQGAVVCESCESVYRIDDRALSCANCNAPLKLAEGSNLTKPRRDVGTYAFLKPLADMAKTHYRSVGIMFDAGGPSLKEKIEGQVTCGWCAHEYAARPASPNCQMCGGVLPLPPSADPGPQPPPAPRNLPKAFANRLFIKQNIGGWLGVGMLLVSLVLLALSFFSCGLALIALLLMPLGTVIAHSNFLTAYRRYQALRRGTPVLGRIESVHLFGEPNGGKPLFHVHYRFDTPGEPLRGLKYTYDKAITNHFVGEPVWVVYLPNSAASNDVWPPLA